MAALLAKKTGRPVRLFLTARAGVHERWATGRATRLPSRRREEGRHAGRAAGERSSASGGAYSDGGTGGVDYVIRELYACPNVTTARTQSVYINAGPQRAFRAPGHPQGAWALEIAMDALAAKLGMDPVELRLKNITAGQPDAQRQSAVLVAPACQCLRDGAKAFGWAEARREGAVGVAHQARRRAWPAACGRAAAAARRRRSSSSCSPTAAPTSTWARATSAAAPRRGARRSSSEELGVPIDRISIEHADTGTTQFATPSGGSKTVPTESPAIHAAAFDVKQQLFAMAAEQLKLPAADLALQRRRGGVEERRRRRRSRSGQIQAFGRRGLLVGVGYRGAEPAGQGREPLRRALRRGRGQHEDRRDQGGAVPRRAGLAAGS